MGGYARRCIDCPCLQLKHLAKSAGLTCGAESFRAGFPESANAAVN